MIVATLRHGRASTAATRLSRVSLASGGLGLASAVFLVVRLLESWRVTSGTTSHDISIVGQKLSYPVANFDAIVILLLAALGLAVTARAVRATVRHSWHGFASKAQRQPLRSASLLSAGGMVGLVVGWLAGRKAAGPA